MGYSNKSITDHLGRTFGTLRISLTNVCNLKCIYCVDPEGQGAKEGQLGNEMSEDQLIALIASIHRVSPLHTIRITGGEPTLYKGLVGFVKKVNQLGIPKIKMTTNGACLSPMLSALVAAGLTEVNISLDAIDEAEYFAMSKRKNLSKTIQTIEQAQSSGLKVKLNTVVVKGVNDNQILPIFAFAKSRNIQVRFLELMKMGHLFSREFPQSFFSENEILNVITSKYKIAPLLRSAGATANCWITEDKYTFGIIANESSPFCGDCDRIRIDSQGNLYGCLSNNAGFSAKEAIHDEHKMRHLLTEALLQKQHEKFVGSNISMINIGG